MNLVFFTGDCYIDYLGKRVDDVRKGDKIGNVVIKCVIKTKYTSGSGSMCEFGNRDGYIGMYNQIKIDGKWSYAKDIYDVAMLDINDADQIEYVYNFVGNVGGGDDIITVNGIECLIMGYRNVEVNSIDDFFGCRTNFINSIKRLSGYNNGLINLDQSNFTSDESGNITGISV